MAIKNELSILTKAEQLDLYSPPLLSLEQQRLYFTPNEIELTESKSIRLRSHRCYFIALLGYFKSKPVILSPSFNLIFDDMQFISTQVQGGKGIRPFSINKMQRDRIYQRILRLLNYQKWEESLHLLHFEEVGDEEKAAITRQVSPVAWQNINLSGTYQFASNRKLPDLQEITRPIVENEV